MARHPRLWEAEPRESPNLAPVSSAWALGWTVLLGLGTEGKTFDEKLAPLTGKNPVPPHKAGQFRYEREKFDAAGLTPIPSECVGPPRVKECPLQFEGLVKEIRPIGGDDSGAAAVEVQVIRVHAHPKVVVDRNHIDPWPGDH